MNPEKLLGGFLRMGLGRSVGLGTKAAIGMGALGVAMAAFDHFTNSQAGTMAPASMPSPASAPSAPPPPCGSSPCPPPPPPGRHSVPPTPPPIPSAHSVSNRDAILLIRAMIAAAHADGQIDAAERKKILERFEKAGLSSEERSFILQELLSPADLDEIANQATTPELAQEVYAISRLAIELDTDAENNYLATLAQRLALDDETIRTIHTQLGVH